MKERSYKERISDQNRLLDKQWIDGSPMVDSWLKGSVITFIFAFMCVIATYIVK